MNYFSRQIEEKRHLFVTSSSLHSLFVIFYTKKKNFLCSGWGFSNCCFFIFNVDILCTGIYIKTKLSLFSRNWCCVFPICSIQCSLPNCRPVSVTRAVGGENTTRFYTSSRMNYRPCAFASNSFFFSLFNFAILDRQVID